MADDAERVEAAESLELPDEQATEALARWLASYIDPGAFIALTGDLGAGKTAFARAFLRALTEDPELEVAESDLHPDPDLRRTRLPHRPRRFLSAARA